MAEENLQDRVEKLLGFCCGTIQNRPALAELYQVLRRSQERLHQPMRVAIVGLIKAGKSTMMNALLGEKVVPTGTTEKTFNVNWFKYGDSKFLKVHYKDCHRNIEIRSFEELEQLTARDDGNNELQSIEFIEVFYPNLLLKELNLVDTPGLASSHQVDSDNTLEFLFLKQHSQELTEITQAEASSADAILFLFDKSISQTVQEIMGQFQGAASGQTTPINAIGVLTKIDDIWSPRENGGNIDLPIQKGLEIANRLQRDHLQLQNLLYTIRPICGLLALGARTLTQNEFHTLSQLAKLPIENLERLIRNESRFQNDDYLDEPDIPLALARKLVLERLGRYGVWLSCLLLNNGTTTLEQLVEALLQRSGVPELQDLILSHFGNRAFLIKLNTVLQQIKSVCFEKCQQVEDADRQLVENIASEFGKLQDDEHALHELRVLRNYYEKKLTFDGVDVEELLAVTGENGTLLEAHLGLSKSTPVSEMMHIAVQKIQKWSQRANDYLGADSQTIDAARVLTHSYERILYTLKRQK